MAKKDLGETKYLVLLNKLNPLKFGGQNVVNALFTNKTDHQKNKQKPPNTYGIKGFKVSSVSLYT